MKKRFGIVSYNMYCNFTNYGSALQTYALHKVLDNIDQSNIESIVVDYCPDVLRDKDILNPIKNMWDSDEESKRMCELSLPAIRINYEKFNVFYDANYRKSSKKYTSYNFEEIIDNEKINGFVCGSDTIWCIQEFGGFDDGYFANYKAMKESHTISYAASFGDAVFSDDEREVLKQRLQNFKAISVRENKYIDFIRENTNVCVERVLDPTLLLEARDYECITSERIIQEPYILLYSRRYNPEMEVFADELAEKLGCKVVEISLRAINASKHIMQYEAGVDEFLSLVKHSECVVTNSYHGAIFSILMHKDFYIFSREQCDNKIDELLELLKLTNRKMVTGKEQVIEDIDYNQVEKVLSHYRAVSLRYLRKALGLEGC